MKYFIALLLPSVLLSYAAHAQSTTSFIGFSVARTTTGAIQFADVDCGGSTQDDHGYRIGVQYQRLLKPRFALEGGIHLAQMRYLFTSSTSDPTADPFVQPRRYRTVSLLVRPKYYFNTQRIRFYLVGGASVDVQTYASVDEDSNSGIGGLLGAGLEGTFGRRVLISLEPSVRILSLIPFVQERYRWRLITAGFQVGIYYGL